jgi:hypothetical protein
LQVNSPVYYWPAERTSYHVIRHVTSAYSQTRLSRLYQHDVSFTMLLHLCSLAQHALQHLPLFAAYYNK